MKVVVGISGASGVQYAIRLLEALREKGAETHLVITESAAQIIGIETDHTIEEVRRMADHHYDSKDFRAPFASGSYPFDAMVVIPCSMGTLSAVACGSSDTLIARASDVCLKEKRKLVLVLRETPLSLVQLRNMLHAAEAGATILPACPGFYSRPKDLDELIDVLVGRVLDQIGVQNDLYRRWNGGAERKCL